MYNKNSKFYKILIISLVLIEGVFIFLSYKSFSDKKTDIDEVELKEKKSINKNNMFAIMLGNNDGTYTESESNVWPTGGYSFNSVKSGCIDSDGNTLEDVLSFDASTWTAKLITSTTAYCYLYFDIDGSAPESFTFYLGGSSNPTYITSNSTSVHLSWSDTDIAYYCLTNTQGSDNCSWQSTNGTSVTPSWTLASGDGTKTVYAYTRDAAGNISPEVRDTIILDSTKPTITSVTKTSDEETSITISVVASDDTSKVKTYYYKIGTGSYTSSTSSTHTFTGLTKGTTYSISVYVVDNAGLQSNVGTYSFATKDTSTAYEEILNNPTSGLNSSIQGGLYRYQGTSVDNYICFGTSDKDTCLNNTDAYIYRIIGITEDGRIKVMKNYALNTSYYWHNTYSTNTTWPNSDLYKGLNGISGGKYSNLFIGNTSYMPSGWEDKIETTTWKYGDNTNVNVTADALYNTENGWANTTNAKIGLIYAHDYAYAYQSGGLNCSSSGAYSTCKTSWMHISVSDSGAPSQYEWTMSRYGLYGSDYRAWIVYSDGYFNNYRLTITYSVRPVFYLKSTVQFEGGTGISTDPFRIS